MTTEDHVRRYLEEHGGEAKMRVMMTDLMNNRLVAWPNSFYAIHRMADDGVVTLSSEIVRKEVVYTNRSAGYQTNSVTVVRLSAPKKETQ